MGIEREWKFRATPQLQEALAADRAVRDMQTSKTRFAMETTYLDTAEGDFAVRRWTLRVRKENGEPVVTLKTPAAGGARGEWEHPGSVPDAGKLLALGAPEALETLLRKPLVPTCGARFTRRAILLQLPGGGLAELALDEGVLFRGDRQAPLCEIELEHKAGEIAETEALAAVLQNRFSLTPERESKHRRAMKL